MKVAIVMGSKSDYPVVQKAEKMFEKFGVGYETRIISAHRTPKQAEAFAAGAEENGFGCIIAAAGKAAHLAGVLAATTPLPVIGIPMKSSTLDGLDSLLSVVQMPKGVPVAHGGDRRCGERGAACRSDTQLRADAGPETGP